MDKPHGPVGDREMQMMYGAKYPAGLQPKPYVWVVGQLDPESDEGNPAWTLQGVFSDRNSAITACRDHNYFVGPVPLDKELPHQRVAWPGCFFPIKP